jgi:Uma2 family endonuclease
MPATAPALPPPLRVGDHLTRDEFLHRWEAMPDLKHAELLDGVVYMPSPVAHRHNSLHFEIGGWLWQYAAATPGCEGGTEGTWLIAADSAPQPDLSLRLLTSGLSRVVNGLVTGAPELAVEISYSSTARDLGIKSDIYRRHGVREYLVILAQENDVLWREAVKGRYRKFMPDSNGVLRSTVFPGLSLDTAALWSRDWPQVRACLEENLATPEHAAFVRRLRKAR